MGSKTHPKVPVIDFSGQKLKPGTTSWSLTGDDVRRALEEYGCFIAVYDKVSKVLENAICEAEKEVFQLPKETKVKNIAERTYHGYVGDISVIPLHESTGIDNATTVEGTKRFTNLMWPNGNDSFSETILSYSKLVKELDEMVQRMVFESYGLEKYCEAHKESLYYLLRLMKYRVPETNESNIGFRAHTDKSFTAIIHQIYIDGLEIATKDDDWIPCDLLPYSFVFFAGDALMGWSNGRIRSAKHRVILNTKEERYSVGLFSFSTGMIQVPEELVDDQHPQRFQPFDHQKFLRFFETEEGRKPESPLQAYCGA
ncbi:probable 2-oxoglutarate-dependent dioxygenase AOP1 [Corylus avellana]|uniref:probable 2-oxoglutarate-dependent dioxygenase AOP1 n=1 Tax=Corylus avellana TaxID=13451 RepID=UPI001E1F6EDB|nr:probable 2-oxoglutarate-dependent dioxygenase AOP1 [Corylus avellana]